MQNCISEEDPDPTANWSTEETQIAYNTVKDLVAALEDRDPQEFHQVATQAVLANLSKEGKAFHSGIKCQVLGAMFERSAAYHQYVAENWDI